MATKYGKMLVMKKINRDLEKIYQMIDSSHEQADQCYRAPVAGDIPRCRICGSQNAELFVSVWGKYHYYECRQCGSLFLWNLPDIAKMYTGNDTMNGKYLIDETVYEQRVKMISEPKVRFVLDQCRENGIHVEQWTDIGCGGGEVLRVLQNSGIQGYGIESDDNECEFAASKGLKVYNRYIDVDKNDNFINDLIRESDVVSILNVLEHVAEPVRFIRYFLEKMRRGGIIVFEVPRHPSMASFANMTCNHAVYRHCVAPIHLQVFSECAVKYLLGDGAEIIGKWEFGQGYTDVLTNAMILSGKRSSPLYDRLMDLSNKIQPIIDEAGFADVMFVVARKR